MNNLLDVKIKRKQRYSYGLSLLRESMEENRNFVRVEDIGKKEVLKVQNISLSFGGSKALADVSLDAKEGELVALIGPNGSGKTSALNVISGFYRAQGGDVFLLNERITDFPSYKRAMMGVCRTFQNLALYTGLSVIDNIVAARHPHIRYNFLNGMLYFPWARREEAKHRAIAEDIIDFLEMEHVRDSIVGMLPYGVRKRVEIGRALALEPRILLLDEPMAGMNVDEKEDIARFIIDVHEFLKIPIILVEHDMEVIMDIADRVFVLDFGINIAEGRPEEIRGDRKVISAFLGEE